MYNILYSLKVTPYNSNKFSFPDRFVLFKMCFLHLKGTNIRSEEVSLGVGSLVLAHARGIDAKDQDLEADLARKIQPGSSVFHPFKSLM